MPTVSEAIHNFVLARRATHNARDLLDRILARPDAWEYQVNVAADKGEPVDGRRNTYTDGEYTWHPIRIPKHANAEPEFTDYKLRWPLDLHAEGLGWTGWDWKAGTSRAWGFDFDALTSHAKGIGVSDEELERVKQAAMAWPLFEVRKSTGGSGIHLYVYADEEGVSTENHTVHAALGRCILGMAGSETDFDFASQIDCCGGNMWFWHRKMTPENGGLMLLKPCERILSVANLPANWRDHIEVINRRRAKVRISGVPDDAIDPFEALTSSHLIVPLDETHKQIIEELMESGFSTVWVPDHHLCQTHTKALEKLMESGKYKGYYRSISQGKNPGTTNCFWFPQPSGAIKVYRFSPGVHEAETWTQDGEGWTYCFFNKKPNLSTACRAMGGTEDEKGGFVFKSADQANKAAKLVGAKLDVDSAVSQRPTKLKLHKDSRLIVEIERSDSDAPLHGYLAKGKQFARILDVVVEEKKEEPTTDLDKTIRYLTTPNGDGAGWRIKRPDGWGCDTYTHAKIALQNDGYSKIEAEKMLGGAVKRAWKQVHLPFQPEYPGDRQWNWAAAQFRYQPVMLADDEAPQHPHWDIIFNHFFSSLDKPLKKLQWAKDAGIRKGGDWGRYWLAGVFREPFEPMPYIFAYGPEGSGKSILHEAISELVTTGITMADRALSTRGDFNGELENTLLAVIEEVDISKHPNARAKIKDWTTTKTLSVRRMRTDSFQQRSTLHFLHLSNYFQSCPVFQNDTRVMVVEVPPFTGKEIPKKKLLEKLTGEAPHFMRTLMDIDLPAPQDRLQLPLVETADKRELADEMEPIGRFMAEKCKLGKREKIIKVVLHKAFCAWAFDNGHDALPIGEFGKQLMAVSKNAVRAKGQMQDAHKKLKHCYQGVCLKGSVA